MKLLISIGIPVRNEIANLPTLTLQISTLIKKSKYRDLSFEIIVNDNLSSDGSSDFLVKWAENNDHVKVFTLEKPLDFQATIQDLMKKSEGELFALLQSDLQDPITVFEEMLDVSLKNLDSVIVGRATKRQDRLHLRIFRKLFYSLLDFVSDKTYLQGFQDFYILPKFVYRNIAHLPSQSLFIRGYLNYSYSNFKFIEYQRMPRVGGDSKFNFSSLYDLALDGLLLYGRKFIRALSIFSFLLFLSSLLMTLFLIISTLLGFYQDTKGWASIAVGLMLLLSFLGILAGLVLEYLIRIHRQLSFRPTNV